MPGAIDPAISPDEPGQRDVFLAFADGRKGTVALSGWGRFPRADCKVFAPVSERDLRPLVVGQPSLIARGNGRAYADAALNPTATIAMRRFNSILSFDKATGLMVCEAGVLLSNVIAATLPQGWFPPVVPGTRHVSVGGMIAADVHGKNHSHAGSFARHVVWIELMIGDGTVVRCSQAESPELFEATLGGMGLTGIVLRAAFTLMRIENDLMIEQTVRCADLAGTFAAFALHSDAPYAVAWVDCLSRGAPGRSLVQLGRHAPAGLETMLEGRLKDPWLHVPSGFPGFLANRAVVSIVNRLHFRQACEGTRLVPLARFFFPLDVIADWNRLYGRRGLVQYQVAFPDETALAGMTMILRRIAETGAAPLLAVLKRLGPGRGMMSFPMPGYTLALDFAATRETLAVLAKLDEVIDLGGRVYLAKDAVSTPIQLARSYPGLAAFRALRERVDPHGRFSSLLAQRVGL